MKWRGFKPALTGTFLAFQPMSFGECHHPSVKVANPPLLTQNTDERKTERQKERERERQGEKREGDRERKREREIERETPPWQHLLHYSAGGLIRQRIIYEPLHCQFNGHITCK